MTETNPDPIRRRKRGRFGLWLVFTLAFLLAFITLAIFALSGQGITAPIWLTERIEKRISEGLGQGSVKFGTLDVEISSIGRPEVSLADVTLANAFGAPIARFARVEAELTALPLLRGVAQARSVRLEGGNLRLRREADGTIDLALGPESGLSATGSVAEILDAVNRAFETESLAALEVIDARGVGIHFRDDLARRVFSVADGRMLLTRQGKDRKRLEVVFDVTSGGETAEFLIAFETGRGAGADGLNVIVEFDNLFPADVAAQSETLESVAALEAPLSGDAHISLSDDGSLTAFAGALAVGEGQFHFGEGTAPLPIENAWAEFDYAPDNQRLTFETFELATGAGSMSATGHGFVSEGRISAPRAIVGQIRVASASLTPEGVLAGALDLQQGALDFRLSLDPLLLEVGEFTATTEGGRALHASGRIGIENDNWQSALNVKSDALDRDAFLAFWPIELARKVRVWMSDNVEAGKLSDIEIALRWQAGEKANFATTFEIADAKVRYLKSLPLVHNASGSGVYFDNSFTLSLDEGHINAPTGGDIDVAGSVFRVTDTRLKPSPAEISLRIRSSVTAALALLDEEPFEFLKKADLPVDLAEGNVVAEARIRTPLAKNVALQEVDYDLTGRVTDVRTDRFTPGKTIASDDLSVSATPEGLTISGPGRIGSARFDGSWHQAFGPDVNGISRFEGSVVLDQGFADEFSIDLPKGSFSGSGTGTLQIDLEKGVAPAFTLTSDLNRLGLRLAALGWSKPAAQTGSLKVAGQLGEVPVIDSLSLKANGLSADGRVTLRPGGGLERAVFSRVRLGRWLDVAATLTGRGKGRIPGISVNSGVIDVRQTSFAKGSGGGSSNRSAAGNRIALALDRLQVSEGIAITGFRGDVTTGAAFSGAFTGRVNGGPTIQGTLAPGKTGTAIRVRSERAGDVLKASGVLKNVRGGTMDLVLTPRTQAGTYTGRLVVEQARLVGASAMAELLNAISVVGLLDQLNGPGIQFTNVEADFVLSPARVTLLRSAAVGPSMGISLDGTYDLTTSRMDMQGVVSPIYAINGIGQIFTRRGEGLFGFNFRLVGPSENPRVAVNPLSILTPGMFREIFRRPPPKVPTQ